MRPRPEPPAETRSATSKALESTAPKRTALESTASQPKRPIAIPAREPTLTGIPLPPATREATAEAPPARPGAPPAPALPVSVLPKSAAPARAAAPQGASMPSAPRHAAVPDAAVRHAAHAPLVSTAAFADPDAAYAPAVAGPYPFGPPTAEVDVSSFLSRSPLATVGGWMAEGMAQLDASGFRLRGVATLGFTAAFAVGLAFTIGFGVGRTTGDAPVAMEAAMVAPSAPSVETEQRAVNVPSDTSATLETAALDTAAAEAAERAIAETTAAADAAEAQAAEEAAEAEAALRSRRTRRARLRRARARRRSR